MRRETVQVNHGWEGLKPEYKLSLACENLRFGLPATFLTLKLGNS